MYPPVPQVPLYNDRLNFNKRTRRLQPGLPAKKAAVSNSAGLTLVSMGGMRPSRLPALATTLTPLSRPHRLPDPSWRGPGECRRALSSIGRSKPERPPFRFETGIGLFAKRPPRPFPPPFLSPPSVSFSDPLSTHHQSRHRLGFVNGELLRGLTNGDDAVYASDFFICANDGVGAWATRPRGHAG